MVAPGESQESHHLALDILFCDHHDFRDATYLLVLGRACGSTLGRLQLISLQAAAISHLGI